MKVYRSLSTYEKGKSSVATIGTFDGVHLGHKVILNNLKKAAQSVKGDSVVISFHPHPRLVLYPHDNPLKLIQTIDEKISMLSKFGIDKLLLIPFTIEFSRLTSEEFIQSVLVDTIDIQKIIIGYDHHFGKNREGGLKDLEKGALEHGFAVEEIPAQQVNDANVSSTKIRNSLLDGDVETAAGFLGYNYPLSGTVIEGQKLGRKLGYPTANIFPDDPLKLIPGEGVYLVNVCWEREVKFGMLNIGKKPTIGKFPMGIEVNILDFEGNLYGETINVSFLRKVRDDQKFDSLESLKAAIDHDKEICLDWIKNSTWKNPD